VLALCVASLASTARAAEPGKAVGTVTISGVTTPLAFAVETKKENLFDSKRQDTVVVLSDKPLGKTAADDEIELSMRARTGELVVLALRIDGSKLVNVQMSHKGLSGIALLPGTWFQYSASKPGVGTLKLDSHEFDGRSYAVSVDFTAAAAPAPRPAPPLAPPAPPPPPAPPKAAPPVPPPKLPPATTSKSPSAPTLNIDRKSATAFLVQAMMKKDEHQALELIKLGADPNGRDSSGIPVLNWAVMMCQPAVVQALVNAKADLKYERAPGMTIMTEAGACPEAAKILRSAGAR
jgi:hypothetical protein